ncbi:MAG: glycosyltransferase family 2 protein [Candidatus Helarchaeota archaeon]|nr:glycosyltransferase family 2 protein [Candidatus Helarchaeota archaeon]
MIYMKYSAVIVSFNQKKAVQRAIESVLKQTILPSEFIIVDNNSTDGTIYLLLKYKKKYSYFRIFRSRLNLETCRGINIGVNLAKNSIIFNMDYDSELMNENWVELAFEKLKKNRVALVWGTSNQGNAPNFRYDNFVGSAILFKKNIYNQVGGFPEDFFIYDNELDLTTRHYITGYYPYFYEKKDVKHGLPAAEQSHIINKGKLYTYYDLSNRLFIYWKYYPPYLALLLSIFHFIQVMKHYTVFFNEYRAPFLGLKRFFNNFYRSVLKKRERLSLKKCFQICYRQQYPQIIYRFLQTVYR